jgi:hypothetical protein
MGYCFYGSSWLRADRSESTESLVPASRREEQAAPRYGELSASTFMGATENIYGYDMTARGYLFVGALNASWLRLHEPDSATLRDLDLLRVSLVGTVVAARHAEAHLLMGVDGLHGLQWTPAFGSGLEIRTYPMSHLTAGGSVQASVFAQGYPLLDSRLEAGVVFGRIDIRAGGRWLFQPVSRADPAGNVSILGPSLTVLIRLGP